MSRLNNFLSLIGALFFSGAAFAQTFTPQPIPSMNFQGLGIDLRSIQVDKTIKESNAVPQNGYEYSTKKSTLIYAPSSSRTKANLQNFVKKTRAVDPASAADMERMLAQVDVMGEAGKLMRGIGLNKNNAADAFAVYWVAAWQAAYGEKDDRNAATYKAVAKQAATGLSQSAEFAKATNAQKQEMAEALIVQAVMVDGAKAAANDPETLRKVGQAVMQGAKETGLDLDKMTLTEKGFVRSTKGSDAGEAVDAADPTVTDKALASADGAAANDNGGGEDDGLSTAQLALIAGAAGAGIAGVFLLGRSMGNKG